MQRRFSVFSLGSALACAGTLLLVSSPTAHAQEFFGQDLDGANGTRLTNRPNSDTARSNFFSNLSGVGTESFEGFANGAAPPYTLTFPGAGTATLTGVGTVRTRATGANDGRYPTTGNNYYDTSQPFDVAFSQDIAAFGFSATDVGDGGDLVLTFSNDGVPVFTRTIPAQTPLSRGNGSVLYFGYINTNQLFDRVSFSTSAPGFETIGFDDLTAGSRNQVAAVPEPSEVVTALFLGGTLGGLMVRRRLSGRRRAA